MNRQGKPGLVLVLVFGLTFPLVAQSLPTGFTSEVVAANFHLPCGLAFLPDGRLLVTEENRGELWVVAAGQKAMVGTVPDVAFISERGLTGVAVDPLWPLWPYVYLFYNALTPQEIRISRYTLVGDLTDPTSANLTLGARYDVITGIPDGHQYHNGGSVRFGPDGLLYASLGDDFITCSSQDTTNLNGAMLRLDIASLRGLTGAGPPPRSMIVATGNPFTGPEAELQWCFGLRQAFRFQVDALTGDLFIADVGAGAWEEISRVPTNGPGGWNLGWPYREGSHLRANSCPPAPPGLVDGIHEYAHNGQGAAVILLAGTYRNQPAGPFNFGAAYEGDVFYADYVRGWIRRIASTGSSWAPPPPVAGQPSVDDWAQGLTTPVEGLVGPDGALYWVSRGAKTVSRVRPAGTPAQLTLISGDQQTGNPGVPLASPIRVRYTGPQGTPLGGRLVHFSVAPAGSLSPAIAVTDASGFAETRLTMAPSPGDPVVTITADGAAAITANARWRGLEVLHQPTPPASLTLTVTHSENNSPVTLAFDAPAPAPLVSTPFGPVWTSILQPSPSFFAFDGVGLVGPPDPAFVTDPATGVWSLSIGSLPLLGNLSLVLQAYAIDTALFPGPDSLMISNAETVTLP